MTVHKTIVIPAALATALASPVVAQSAPDGFFIKGYAEIESVHDKNNDDTFGRVDFDLGFEPSSLASNLPIGFTLGIDSVQASGLHETAVYGALTIGTDFGKWSVGIPRPVVDEYLEFPPFGGSREAEFELSTVGLGSIVTTYSLLADETPYGLRYDGTFGNIDVGATYHRFDDASADIFGLAMRYHINDAWTAAGTIEHGNAASSVTTYAAAIEGKFDRVGGGLRYTHSDIIGSTDVVDGYLTYTPIERLDLTASALHLDAGGTTSLYGLSGRYNSNLGAYVQAGVLDGSNGFATRYDVSIGWEF